MTDPIPTDIPQVTEADVAATVPDKKADDDAHVKEAVRRRKGRQISELVTIGTAVLGREVRKGEKPVTERALSGDNLTERDYALLAAEEILSGDFCQMEGTGKDRKLAKASQDDDGYYNVGTDGLVRGISMLDRGGSPIIMPEIKGEDDSVILEGGQFSLATIVRRRPDGKYIVQVAYPATGDIVAEDGRSTVSDTKPALKIALTKEELLGLQIASEDAAYRQVAPDNPAFAAFVDAASGQFDPPDGFDDTLAEGARAAGLPTTKALAEELETAFPDATTRSARLVTLLSKFDVEEGAIPSREDFVDAMNELGVGKQSLDVERTRLQGELHAQGTSEERQVEIRQQLQIIDKLKTAWDKMAKEGLDPMGMCYDAMRNGGLDFGVMLQAAHGDPQPLFDSLVDVFSKNSDLQVLLDMTDAQKEQIKNWLSKNKDKIGKGLLWTLLVGLATPIILGVSVGLVGFSTGSALAKSQG